MTTYQAKIDHIDPRTEPDEYDASRGRIPTPEFVMARDDTGRILSRYRDDEWDRTPYHPKKKPYKIIFRPWGDTPTTEHRENLKAEMKWIMFILIYLTTGSPLTNGSLNGYICQLRKLARRADKNSISIAQLLSRPKLVLQTVERSQLSLCLSIVKLINRLGPEVTGIEIDHGEVANELKDEIRKHVDSRKQTVPIPMRIYSSILSKVSEELSIASEVLDRFLDLVREYCSDPLIGLERDNQTVERKILGLEFDYFRPTFDDLLNKHELNEFWHEKGLRRTGQSLGSFLLETQCFASLQIQAFTGMRGDETDSLPFDCLSREIRNGDNRAHYVISGSSPKGKRKKDNSARWITSNSGRVAVEIAQKIVNCIYEILDRRSGEIVPQINRQLFITPSCIFERDQDPKILSLQFSDQRSLVEKISVPIIQDDIDELCLLDGHRDWASEEDFKIGGPWKLKRHQLRRSLALYAHASGLVSLPSLKRQLQHITQEMALYYCKGSAFARSFVGDGNSIGHIVDEWQEAEPISRGLAYIANVLLSDQNELFGPHIAWNHTHRKNDDGDILADREATLSAVKKGQYSYNPNPIGGCTKAGKCDKVPLSVLHVECMRDHCKHMVGDMKKISQVIQIQEIQVEKIRAWNSDSVEFRIEENVLVTLKAGLEEGRREIDKRNAKHGH